MIDEEIKEYTLAIKENVAATHAETQAVLRKKLARERLYKAKQALWDREHELLEVK